MRNNFHQKASGGNVELDKKLGQQLTWPGDNFALVNIDWADQHPTLLNAGKSSDLARYKAVDANPDCQYALVPVLMGQAARSIAAFKASVKSDETPCLSDLLDARKAAESAAILLGAARSADLQARSVMNVHS